MQALAFTTHDHKRCRRSTLRAVVQLCKQRGLKLTPVRQQALEILLEAHAAIGAYDVLDKLRHNDLAETPPQAYRALHFLVDHGFAHRLELHNAFVACTNPAECCNPCFMICENCGLVAEQTVPTANKQLAKVADNLGFTPDSSIIEISGLCSQCTSVKS